MLPVVLEGFVQEKALPTEKQTIWGSQDDYAIDKPTNIETHFCVVESDVAGIFSQGESKELSW